FVDIHSARDRMPQAVVRDMTGAVIGSLPLPPDRDIEALKLRPAEIVTTKAETGETLYGALLAPRTMKPGEKHPVVVMVYGGPHGQSVFDMYDPRLMWQHLADRGFVVFQLDNRGTSGRGAAFEQVLYHHIGTVELQDQLAGVAY